MRKIFNVEYRKYFIVIFILIIGVFFLEISNDFNYENLSASTSNLESEDIAVTDVGVTLEITLVSGTDLIPNSTKTADMQKNTKNLQDAIDKVSESGGGVVYLPTGTFYFSKGGIAAHSNEDYAIRCRNNVHLKGAGTNENNSNNLTILKPYYYSPKADGGMDMFYFNNYADTGYNNTSNVTTSTKRDVTYTDINGTTQTLKNQTVYLINADFSDFIVDGDESRGGIAACGGVYKTDGKGFMINLFKDCDWDNVVVKNTDATGFGIDCPLNSTMTNCKAINCGKAATQSDGGASGFGIGTGYSNDESLIISNCVAINNKKFGFFFEHQSRFSSTHYPATTSKGFVVSNSVAGGNMYDFGGLKAYDVTFENVQSLSGKVDYTNTNFKKTTSVATACNRYTTITYSNNTSIKLNTNTQPIYFSMYSKNIYLTNTTITNYITDITSNTTENKWAINNGIIPLVTQTKYQPSNTMTRFEIINSLWRYANMPGTISATKTSKNDISSSQDYITKTIGYTDLGTETYQYDLDSIIWAYQSGIISKDTKFNPSNNCTRAQFVTMLYRLAGSPTVSGTIPFTDVEGTSYYYKAVVWGYNVGVIKGSTSNTFTPDLDITKSEVAIFLYRYHKLSSNTYRIIYNLNGGVASGNPTSYKKTSSTITLKNPTKSGYTFAGWTGSNGVTASTSVSIKKGTVGNLVYTANWKANLSSIGIKTKPTTTSYYTNDKVNTAGLVLNAYYTDSNVEEVTGGYTTYPTTLTTAGTQKITITYNGKTTSYNVNVTALSASSISINTNPNKLDYYLNDSVDTTGLVLNVKYNNGTTKTITSGYTSSPTTLTQIGTQKITVTYDNKTTTYDVNVKKNDVKSIAIKSVPETTLYYEGDYLDTTGLTLKVIYNNGNTKEITSGYTVDTTQLTTPGKQTITVTYASQTTTFNVTVNKIEISSIAIKNLPNQTTYFVGDSFSSEGLTLSIYKNSGYIEEITTGFTLSVANGTKLTKGTHSITVTYSGKTTTFDIIVNELQQESLILLSRPTKTNYVVGDKFTTSGLELQYIDATGKKNNITSGYAISFKDGTILNQVGTQTITITYNNKQVNFNIKVNKVKKLEVNKSIIKTEYNVGETFELANIDLTATYQDDTKEKITNGYDITIEEGTTFTTPGEKNVTITYGGSTTTFKVNVSDSEENVEKTTTEAKETSTNQTNNLNLLYLLISIGLILVIGIILYLKYKKNQKVE